MASLRKPRWMVARITLAIIFILGGFLAILPIFWPVDDPCRAAVAGHRPAYPARPCLASFDTGPQVDRAAAQALAVDTDLGILRVIGAVFDNLGRPQLVQHLDL